MSLIRVLIADLPHMMRDIVLALAEVEPDLVIAGYRQEAEDERSAVERTHADVVLRVAAAAGDAGEAESLLYANPRLRVLTITPDGRAARMKRLVISDVVLEDLSPGNLMDALLSRGVFGNGTGL